MKIARVFPRITRATPIDTLQYVGPPPSLFPPDVDEVHISVSFTWDKDHAEWLAEQWKHIAPVKIGGPAYNEKGGEFIPGKYIKPGYVITSRGCNNSCWFCKVWKREGREIRELPIVDGWNVLDDNLLACSDDHIKAVFSMLGRQKHKAEFTGGLEAALLKHWHVELLADLRPSQMFFAYDTPDDYEPLRMAAGMLAGAGFNRQTLRAYVLIGYPSDTIEKARKRLHDVVSLGVYPMAMLYHDDTGKTEKSWDIFQRLWARPALIHREIRRMFTRITE